MLTILPKLVENFLRLSDDTNIVGVFFRALLVPEQSNDAGSDRVRQFTGLGVGKVFTGHGLDVPLPVRVKPYTVRQTRIRLH